MLFAWSMLVFAQPPQELRLIVEDPQGRGLPATLEFQSDDGFRHPGVWVDGLFVIDTFYPSKGQPVAVAKGLCERVIVRSPLHKPAELQFCLERRKDFRKTVVLQPDESSPNSPEGREAITLAKSMLHREYDESRHQELQTAINRWIQAEPTAQSMEFCKAVTAGRGGCGVNTPL